MHLLQYAPPHLYCQLCQLSQSHVALFLISSTVPFIGISTGSIELRADGKFHEWTIFNQHPAGAAKMHAIEDVFLGVRAATADSSVAMVLQTNPNDTRLPAVDSLQYQGTLHYLSLTYYMEYM